MDARELHALIEAGRAPVRVDVRSRIEFAGGHVPGAIHIPFWSVVVRAGELRAERTEPLVVYCGHGPRAIAARLGFAVRGFTNVRLLRGHMAEWRRLGLSEER